MALANQTLFSIIIPTYNHAHLINRCIQSVIDQSYGNWEIIVVNNFSEDNTIDVVNSFKDQRIRLFNFRNNGIIGASRNYGFNQCKGDWVCFLDSDDWYRKDRLEKILSSPMHDYHLMYHPLDIMQEEQYIGVTPVRQLSLTKPYKDLLYNLNTIATSSTCIERNFFSKCGYFSEDRILVGVEDFDLWIRLAKNGMKAKLINESLGFYHVGNGNITYRDERQIKRLTNVYQQYITKSDGLAPSKIRGALFYLIGKVYLENKKFKKAGSSFFTALYIGSKAIKIRAIYHLLRLLCGKT